MSYTEISKQKFEQLKSKKDVYILSIESSCDETSVAIVKNGRGILANIISSQIEIHRRFGGVVPEVASRNHITAISNVTNECLQEANMTLQQIDAIAVTYGAGLLGALLVGVNYAKALAYSLNLPLIAVSHIKGHIAANYLSHIQLEPPFVCLMVSGGHTCILDIQNYNKIKKIGSTIDDAVGEAFDKVARVLELPYPGGPEIDKLAINGQNNIVFTHKNSLRDSYDFSFSGIKTAVINYMHTAKQKSEQVKKEDVAASFQHAVVGELSEKVEKYIKQSGAKKLVVAGGVGANSFLRNKLQALSEKDGFEVFMPKLKLCTDNAAMIGSAAYYMLKDGMGLAQLDLTAKSTVNIGD